MSLDPFNRTQEFIRLPVTTSSDSSSLRKRNTFIGGDRRWDEPFFYKSTKEKNEIGWSAGKWFLLLTNSLVFIFVMFDLSKTYCFMKFIKTWDCIFIFKS